MNKKIFFLLVLCALLAFGGSLALMARPIMNDIATDPDHPIEYQKLLGKKYKSNFAAMQKKYYPGIQPLKIQKPPEQVFKKIVSLASQQSRWKIVFESDLNKHVEITAQSRILRFTDDVVIQVQADGLGSIVQMRSRSRLGRSDFGVNAKRISSFLAALESATY